MNSKFNVGVVTEEVLICNDNNTTGKKTEYYYDDDFFHRVYEVGSKQGKWLSHKKENFMCDMKVRSTKQIDWVKETCYETEA